MHDDLVKRRTCGLLAATALFLGGVAFATTPAWAVDDLGLFELDGNAVQNVTPPPDDWETLHNGGGSADVFTGVTPDAGQVSIFSGSNKDTHDVSTWDFKTGSVSNKSNITNAYAASYTDDGDLIVYFGADRFDNNGDTFLGFWFFKGEVTLDGSGNFVGSHQVGDTLVLVNFPQATNAVPLVQVVSWDPNCSKADGPNPVVGQCAAPNLRLEAGASGAGAVCDPAVDPQLVCAITNEEGTANAAPGADSTAPWPYTAQDGTTGQFPFETFFEGGINLSEVIGGDACFASFMAESRSASSFTASLEDFVLDAFPVCGIDVTKACTGGTLNADDTITYDITGSVINTGLGTVFDIDVTDSPDFDDGSLAFDADPSSLAGGASIGYSATITVPLSENGTDDTVTASAFTSETGGTELTATATATCPTVTINPAASVDKTCESFVEVTGDPLQVVAQVSFSGQVCNTGDTRLDDVTVTDDQAGLVASFDSIAAGECEPYSGSYTPTEANDADGNPTTDPSLVVFSDTVTVSATDILGSPLSPEPTANADCPLCPPCPDCE